ncbi:hypothetical protein [Streptosporangium sp. NPDC000396]|uniref:hypothetical protein n=1 Tax=Streptosporangium sp. NPDC000396 TaxID=3366185 RepID=UPI003682E96C
MNDNLTRALPAVLLLALSLTACGGTDRTTTASSSSSSASASASKDPQEARLKFAQCMRENGVQMDDPDANGGIRIKGDKGQQANMEKAMKACQPLMEGAIGKPDPQTDQKMRDQMLKFAQCMRQHGIDMPDPEPGGMVKVQVPEGVNKQQVEKAHEACKEFAPGGLR